MITHWWHDTKVKYSVVLAGHKNYMNDPKVKDAKHQPYDNRHLKEKRNVTSK